MYEDLIQSLRHHGLENGGTLGRHMGIMDIAADTIERLAKELEWKEKVLELAQRTERKAEAERDAAASDLEEIMLSGGRNIDTCNYCVIDTCYDRGGYELCAPKWRGRVEKRGGET